MSSVVGCEMCIRHWVSISLCVYVCWTVFFCMSMSGLLYVCLSFWLCVCVFGSMSVCLSVCLCLYVCLHVCLSSIRIVLLNVPQPLLSSLFLSLMRSFLMR